MKKFIALSDLHGVLPEIKEQVDILLVAGDIVPLRFQRDMEYSRTWFRDEFLPWTETLPIKYVVLVGGNHDFWMEKRPEEVRNLTEGTKVDYLLNEYRLYVFPDTGDLYSIFGTPFCKPFRNWAFMKDLDEQREILKPVMGDTKEKLVEENNLPHLTTILLTHDAPYGVSDVIQGAIKHLGNPVICELVEGMKPDIHIHGHLHSANHGAEMIGDTRVYNVSLLGEDYTQQYQPLIFSL